MKDYTLELKLLSDTTLGRGDGVAGLVDVEVQHDRYGLPYLGGRALKGLLGAECDDLVFALDRPGQRNWQAVADRLFGQPGAALRGRAILRFGPARLPADLRQAIAYQIESDKESNLDDPLTREAVLETLTTLRRQTAMDPVTGAPLQDTLRALRLVLRGTVLTSRLAFRQEPTEDDLALLAATVKALRRAGTGRNRGRGRLRAELLDAAGQPVTDALFADFRKAVGI
jgi:CRISPR/Cas system CSM-associated protein Csm3 (group 7 of RAMP superfamily)